MSVDRYTYVVWWYEHDQQFVGQCTVFPSLSHLADTPNDALSGVRDLVADTLEDMRRSGETLPDPGN